jgi:UrcA family protein
VGWFLCIRDSYKPGRPFISAATFLPVDATERFVAYRGSCMQRFPGFTRLSIRSDRYVTFNGGMAMNRSSLAAALGAITIAALSFAPASCAAGEKSQIDGIAVRFSQEALDNPEDAARVYAKLKFASQKACGLIGGFLNMSERTRANRCYEQTLAEVVSKINRPMLSSVHAAKLNKVG